VRLIFSPVTMIGDSSMALAGSAPQALLHRHTADPTDNAIARLWNFTPRSLAQIFVIFLTA